MARTDLRVPYSEKDEAKQLGARWDSKKRVWYVPDGQSIESFTRWLDPRMRKPEQSHVSPTVRSTRYYISQATTQCWKCGQPTRVFCFLLPSGYEELVEADDNDGDEAVWERCDCEVIPMYVEYLIDPVIQRMQGIAGTSYCFDFTKSASQSYWCNHCEHYSAIQGDNSTIAESNSPFSPNSKADAAKILLRHIQEPFAADASSFSIVDFFSSMQHLR